MEALTLGQLPGDAEARVRRDAERIVVVLAHADVEAQRPHGVEELAEDGSRLLRGALQVAAEDRAAVDPLLLVLAAHRQPEILVEAVGADHPGALGARLRLREREAEEIVGIVQPVVEGDAREPGVDGPGAGFHPQGHGDLALAPGGDAVRRRSAAGERDAEVRVVGAHDETELGAWTDSPATCRHELVAVVEVVVRQSVPAATVGRDVEVKALALDAAGEHEPAIAVFTRLEGDPVVHRSRQDLDDATHGVAAVEGAERSPDHFDALHALGRQQAPVEAAEERAVELDPVPQHQRVVRLRAADEDRRRLALRAGAHDVDPRDGAQQVGHCSRLAGGDLLAFDDGGGDG